MDIKMSITATTTTRTIQCTLSIQKLSVSLELSANSADVVLRNSVSEMEAVRVPSSSPFINELTMPSSMASLMDSVLSSMTIFVKMSILLPVNVQRDCTTKRDPEEWLNST